MVEHITTIEQFREFTDAQLDSLRWSEADDLEFRFIDDQGDNVSGFGDRAGEITVHIGRITQDDGPGSLITKLATVPLTLLLDAASGHASASRVEAEEVWHEFYDGPWAGQRVRIEQFPGGYEHLVPHRPEPGIGEWVPADTACDRYVRTGSYGETVVMTWWPGRPSTEPDVS
jgi:hypothetical protein